MKRIVYSSPFVPAEFITAHGFYLERIIPASGKASKHGSAGGMCQYAQSFVDEVAKDRRIDAVVLTTTCDQMRRAADLIARFSKVPVFLMNVPATGSPASRRLYRSELERLGRFLVGLGGRAPSARKMTEVMMSAIGRENGSPGTVRPTVCSAGRAGRLAEPSLSRTTVDKSAPPSGKPIALIGGPLPADERWLIAAIEKAGGRIVLDGTENGERAMPAPFNRKRLKTDPMAELVRAYFDTIPDVFQRPNDRLYEWLDRKLAERGVSGIIVRHYVWCDLWRAEVQRIIERTNLPVLHIDTEGGNRSKERTVGRVEAFFEMLK